MSFAGTSLYTDLIEAEFNEVEPTRHATLWGASPVAHVDRAKTPTLLLHGESDMDVPITQAEEMYGALRKRGIAATLARYPNEGHGFQEPRHIRDAQQRADAWFDQYLKPATVTP